MDPLTHALVGAGVAGLSGGEISITNPIVLASMMGAVAPDLDIVYQLRGDMAYLKVHRGFSHSIPGLALISGVIAGGLSLFFPEASLLQLFVWSFIGAISHSLLDVLNSYGAKIFAPFSNRRYTWNLLMITDPVLLLLIFGVLLAPGNTQLKSALAILGFILYLRIRLRLRMRVEKSLQKRFAVSKLKRIVVMPSMMGLWTWDFVVETEKKCIVGQINSFASTIKVRRKLAKTKKHCQVLQAALNSKLGKLFKEFTPHYHLVFSEVNDTYVVDFLDLRYLLKRDFMHTGTAVFDQHLKVVESFFQPYSKQRKIDISA
ncbi:MAG: metal-dependent hydrolase [Bacillota bacterium]|nr:metal-dependent hydrolase [Bacillota bacterium]